MTSVSIVELLIKGIPESLVTMIALYVFTSTKVGLKKYILLSLLLAVITYLTRWFPINLGTHTMLILLALMLIHLAANKGNFNYVIKTIVSVIVIALIVLISETLDFLLLAGIYGEANANEMLLSSNAVIKSVSALPATALFGVVVLVVYFIKKKRRNKKRAENGAFGKETGE